MSSPSKFKVAGAIALLAAVLFFAYLLFKGTDEIEERDEREQIAAVAVAPIERRAIEQRRLFSGALEAHSKFVVAPKVAGRIEDIPVDISDTVYRGDTVAILDDAEFDQDVRQSQADLAVAEANLAEATSALEIALRANQRATTLRERGIASESEYDTVQAELLSREAQVEVAKAQVVRAQSSLESARIRLGYTRIAADWSGDEDPRVVAERYVDEGETVSANEPLLLIVDLNPITAVIHVTERDYGLLQPGYQARFYTDAFPGEPFEGKVDRISPIFLENSRQARVELALENPQGELKPGMFVRADISLRRVEDATVVPYAAITRRGNEEGVFLVSSDSKSVAWQPVQTGIRSGESIQLLDDLTGRVVVLGQHLLDDGSPIIIPEGPPVEIDS